MNTNQETINLDVDKIIDKLSKFKINSDDLVPGDVYALKTDIKIPCDSVLIDGEIVLNEVNLNLSFF